MRRGTWCWWGRRRRGSRPWRWRWPAGWATSSWCRPTPCRCTGAWTSARPRPRRPSGPRCPTTCSTWPSPSEDFSVARFQAAGGRGASPASRRGATGPCWWAAPACTCRRWSTGWPLPGEWPDVQGRAGGAAAPGELYRRLADARPRRRRPHRARQRPPARAGPGGDPGQRPAVLVVRPRPGRLPAHPRSGWPASGCPARCWPSASRPATRPSWTPASSTRCAGLRRPRCRAPPARPSGYRELLAHLAGDCTLDEAVDAAVRRTREFARRQRAWFRRDPRITWLGAPANPVDLLPALLGDWSLP